MAYNAALTDALQFFEGGGSLSATTHPSSTQAATIWEQAYLQIFATLAKHGITIGTGNDLKVARYVEALCTSYEIQAAQLAQDGGEIDEETKSLKARCDAALERLCDQDYAAALGATVDATEGVQPSSLATDYPDADQDLTDLDNPLPLWTSHGNL